MKRSSISTATVSLVIPAYNEAPGLRACLKAATNQTAAFDEIIVVDNNSTDQTAAIARSFPAVKVIHEPQQGKVYARTAGFNAARGEIIARIDADTHLPADWNVNMQAILADTTIAAVSGLPRYYDLALPRMANAVEHFFRRLLAYELRDTMFLQGANMAIRRSAWQAVQPHLCSTDRHVHEDFDLAIHLQRQELRVVYDEQLVAGISARAVDVSLPFFVQYVRMNVYSYAQHNIPHYRRMYPVIICIFVLFYPARMLFRGRDPRTGAFSVAQLFTRRRPNPRVASVPEGIYLS